MPDYDVTRAVRSARLASPFGMVRSRPNSGLRTALPARKIVAGLGICVGPALHGMAKPVHILTPTTRARGMGIMTALAAVAAAHA